MPKKAHGLATGREILGGRWARDHVDDKTPVLAAALEVAFDPAKSMNSIALDQAARNEAAAWLPPGMAYDGLAMDAVTDDADPVDAVPEDTGSAGIDPEATDLPAFLTEEEPAEAALDGVALAAE